MVFYFLNLKTLAQLGDLRVQFTWSLIILEGEPIKWYNSNRIIPSRIIPSPHLYHPHSYHPHSYHPHAYIIPTRIMNPFIVFPHS